MSPRRRRSASVSGTSATSAAPPSQSTARVAAARLRGEPRQRKSGRGRDGAAGEEKAAVAPGLALRHEAGEVGEAERGHEPGAERGDRERGRSGHEAVRGSGRQQAGAEHRGAAEQQPVHTLGTGPCAEQHPERGEHAEGERKSSGGGEVEAEVVLGVQDEERGERGVGEDPERLREQHLARAVATQRLAQCAPARGERRARARARRARAGGPARASAGRPARPPRQPARRPRRERARSARRRSRPRARPPAARPPPARSSRRAGGHPRHRPPRSCDGRSSARSGRCIRGPPQPPARGRRCRCRDRSPRGRRPSPRHRRR